VQRHTNILSLAGHKKRRDKKRRACRERGQGTCIPLFFAGDKKGTPWEGLGTHVELGIMLF